MNPWVKATVVSALVALVFTLSTSIIFGGGGSYPPAVEWERVNEMKYQEAQEYLAQLVVSKSGWAAFRQGVQSPLYWQHLFIAWVTSFALALIACAALLKWLRTSSNISFQGTASSGP